MRKADRAVRDPNPVPADRTKDKAAAGPIKPCHAACKPRNRRARASCVQRRCWLPAPLPRAAKSAALVAAPGLGLHRCGGTQHNAAIMRTCPLRLVNSTRPSGQVFGCARIIGIMCKCRLRSKAAAKPRKALFIDPARPAVKQWALQPAQTARGLPFRPLPAGSRPPLKGLPKSQKQSVPAERACLLFAGQSSTVLGLSRVK